VNNVTFNAVSVVGQQSVSDVARTLVGAVSVETQVMTDTFTVGTLVHV